MRRIVIAARVVALLGACGVVLGLSAADAEELAAERHAVGIEHPVSG
jgi:hypothetical protein